jgi:hypothetical protein
MKFKTNRLLVNYLNCEYYREYDAMISRLAPMLQTPPRHARLIERLDFRCDLPRGSKKIIYQELGALLARPDIMARGFRKNDLIRWLVLNSNLNVSYQALQSALRKLTTIS